MSKKNLPIILGIAAAGGAAWYTQVKTKQPMLKTAVMVVGAALVVGFITKAVVKG